MASERTDDPADAVLTTILRQGDVPGEPDEGAALEVLFRRHRASVVSYARLCCRDPHTAEDLASEAFARTLQAVRSGSGPQDAWRPYLLTVVRRTAAQWAATDRRTDLSPDFEQWVHGAGAESADPDGDGERQVLRREDASLVRFGFEALPERWQAVLWHTVVENESAGQVGELLGLSASGVTSLAARAREGLREAYLTAHLDRAGEECRKYAALLASRVRRSGLQRSRELDRHLDDCARCRTSLLELTELSERMRSALPVALLLWGGSGYVLARSAADGPEHNASGHGDTGHDGPGQDGTGHDGTGGDGSPGRSGSTRAAERSVRPGLGGHPFALAAAGAAVVAAIIAGFYFAHDADDEGAPPAAYWAEPTEPLSVVTETATSSPSVSSSRTAKPSRSSGPSTSPSPVERRKASSTPSEPAWRPAPDLSSTLRIASTGNCMEPEGTKLREAACTGADNQVWELSWDTSADGGRAGTVHVRNHGSGMCLVYSGSGQDGAPVPSQTCDKAASHQQWQVSADNQAHRLVLVDPVTNHFLGLNDWWNAGEGNPHDATIGTTANYYATPSLRLLYEGTLS